MEDEAQRHHQNKRENDVQKKNNGGNKLRLIRDNECTNQRIEMRHEAQSRYQDRKEQKKGRKE